MNFEPRAIDPATSGAPHQGVGYDGADDGSAQMARRRRTILIAFGAAVVLLIVVGMWLSHKHTASAAAAAAAAHDSATPTVTVVSPGRSLVENVVTATGSLAARVEMPVGSVGEGGQVAAVLVQPGQWVGAGQVLAQVDRSVQTQQIAQLQAQIAVAQSNARLAQATLDRALALVDRGFVSRADIDTKTAQRDAANAQVRVAQATLAEARARTGRLDIRAPGAGLVLARNVEPGQVVGAASGVLFRIARGGEMEMKAQVGEGDMRSINVGARATVTPVGTTQGFAGQVWQVAPVIDPQTRQGVVRIALPYNPALRPGGFAEARIVAGAAQAPMLPQSALLSDDQGTYVYIVGADNKVQRRAVTIGEVTDNGISIAGGLNGDERIVQSAGPFLTVGQVIHPVLARPAR